MFEATPGAAAPAAPAGEQQANTAAAQSNAATTDPQTGSGEGGEGGQVTPKTYTEQEHRDAIERATAKAAAKAERRAFREATARLASQQPAPQQSNQSAGDGKPTRAQFADDEAYVDALTDWKLDRREAQVNASRQQQQAATLATKTEAIYAEAEKLPGFDRDEFNDLPLTRPIVEALIESDAPAKLMHYMAANPAEVERIAKLTPARQAAELGKLEAKAMEAKPQTRSNAPAALASVKGAAPGSMPDPANTKAYIKWANEQERSARR